MAIVKAFNNVYPVIVLQQNKQAFIKVENVLKINKQTSNNI